MQYAVDFLSDIVQDLLTWAPYRSIFGHESIHCALVDNYVPRRGPAQLVGMFVKFADIHNAPIKLWETRLHLVNNHSTII